eukprot:CAMPEP_0185800750 /NCGR_PEP_ID=MMETSP1322-20130828/1050_1 /TAXON_ID=265543 /ORGANISM="Minutocellus polymorphus, Strain RCC2270" /LENGTH=361 /DNA_ID=CAMNT_0028496405 /DNA_START=47 /DNA_END=1132 /DNA_ORIENTATION=+
MSHMGGRKQSKIDWAEVRHDIVGGIRSGAYHSAWYVKNWAEQTVVHPTLSLLGFNVAEEKPTFDGLKIVGVGYGRTGTYSLRLALEELGYPTLHTQHLYENHEIFNMWSDGIFNPSIEADEILMGRPNFDLMAERGFAGTMDFPSSLYYEQIMEQYPDAKFILTVRSDPEIWFRSWDTLSKTITQPTRYWQFMAHVQQYNNYLRWLFSVVNRDTKYLNCDMPFPDQMKERAIASYEEHNRRVREMIPQDRLLEYNVKQGWAPLCQFLEIESCPTTAFPKTNSARSLQIQTISAMAIPLTITLFVLFYVFSCVFQRTTNQSVLGWLGMKRLQILEYLTGREMMVQKRRAERAAAKKKGRKQN